MVLTRKEIRRAVEASEQSDQTELFIYKQDGIAYATTAHPIHNLSEDKYPTFEPHIEGIFVKQNVLVSLLHRMPLDSEVLITQSGESVHVSVRALS